MFFYAGIKKGFTKEEAALEELEEEMNLSTDKKLIPFGFIRELPNVMDHVCYLFVAEEVYTKTDKIAEITESFSNRRKIHIKEAYNMSMRNEFECASTQLLIIKYYLNHYQK